MASATPRFYSEEELRAMSTEKKLQLVAELQSANYIAAKEREQSQRPQQAYRGGGRGRGKVGFKPYARSGYLSKSFRPSDTTVAPARNGPSTAVPSTDIRTSVTASIAVAPEGVAASIEPQTGQVQINGIFFEYVDNGARLVRVHPYDNTNVKIPQEAIVGNAKFLRTADGNLTRVGSITEHSSQPTVELCSSFTSSGQCRRGNACRYRHDPDKVAICKGFLSKGSCATGSNCDLSHVISPHNVPTCSYFLSGNCTNDDCKYAHVNISPSAPHCIQFGRIGYCEKGVDCPYKHAFECPDYANNGVCTYPRCRLQHTIRAGRLRKATPESPHSDQASSPLAVVQRTDGPAGIDETLPAANSTDDNLLSQQQDFVPF